MANPESFEPANEVLKDNPYGETVQGLIEDASNFNVNQLTRLIQSSLIEEIVASAERGEITSQFVNEETGQKETFVYTVDDIFAGQIATALQAQDESPDKPASWGVNIPRSNGLRAAVMAVMTEKRLAEPFRYAVYHKRAELVRQKDLAASESGLVTEVPEALRAQTESLREKAEEDLGEEALEASGVELEVAAASRIVSLDNQEVQNDPYDYLRAKLPPVTKEAAANATENIQRNYYEKFVTEENRSAAQSMLAIAENSTPEIREVLSRYDISPISIEAVDAIREHPEVRFEVAKALVIKLDELLDRDNDMGWRVNANYSTNLKTDPMTGVKLTSRLYVVSMALKMIGGEFTERLEGKHDLLRGSDGVVVAGQHRHAARTLLMAQIK